MRPGPAHSRVGEQHVFDVEQKRDRLLEVPGIGSLARPPEVGVEDPEEVPAVVAALQDLEFRLQSPHDPGRLHPFGRVLVVDRRPDAPHAAHAPRQEVIEDVVEQEVADAPFVVGGADVLVDVEDAVGPQARPDQAHELGEPVEVVERGVEEDGVQIPGRAEPRAGVPAFVGDARLVPGFAGQLLRLLDAARADIQPHDLVHDLLADHVALEVADAATEARGAAQGETAGKTLLQPGGGPHRGVARDAAIDPLAHFGMAHPQVV